VKIEQEEPFAEIYVNAAPREEENSSLASEEK